MSNDEEIIGQLKAELFYKPDREPSMWESDQLKVPGWEYLEYVKGEEARWGSRDWFVYTDGERFIGIRWYAGATENQEDEFEEIEFLTRKEITIFKYDSAVRKEKTK